ncbi:hypothetical protein GGI43DRAFT_164501 [Trichoderma evansii]
MMFSVLSGSAVYTITILRFWPVSWWPLHLETTGHSFFSHHQRTSCATIPDLDNESGIFQLTSRHETPIHIIALPVLSILIINLTTTYYLLQFLKGEIRKGSS